MPRYPYIVLDAYPLGNAIIPLAGVDTVPNDSQECRRWMLHCEASGTEFLVPAISYYEVVREMEQRQAMGQIKRFQNFCFDPDRFIVLTTEHLSQAAALWGQARRSGQATADPKALDGDAILAAQVLSLGLQPHEYVVATRNTKHLTRFGLNAAEWRNIAE